MIQSTTENLTYISQIVNEALRFCPPLLHTTEFYVKMDIVSGNNTIKAGDFLSVNIRGLHFNKNEW